MFTDMVGYSQMVAKDEKLALSLLDEHNQVIFPIVEKFHGRVIKLIGDAVFAEFTTSFDAIQSAMNIQAQFRVRNQISHIEDQIQIRIGLHTGEVIEKDNDLFGHDVNLGSRIENSTPPGCITASKEVVLAIKNNKDIFKRKIGHVKLKNIPDPKLLYKIYLDLLDYNNDSDVKLYDGFIERGIEIVDIKHYNVQKIISLGMLYLTNLGSEKDEYISHNITESILSDLGGIKQLRTPGFSEVVRYNKSELPISEIARRLQVNRLVHGTLLVKGDIITITLAMLETDNGTIIWNKKWETHSRKLIQLQNQLLSHILEKLEIEISDQLKKQFAILPTENSKAYDEYQKARYIMAKLKKKEDFIQARKHLKNAVKKDPSFVWAQAQLGYISHKMGYNEKAEEQLYFALEIAKQDGTTLSNAYVYNQLGILYNHWGRYKKALTYNTMALEIQSQLDKPIVTSTYLHNLANSYKNLGDTGAALKYYEQSLKIKQMYERRDLQPHTFAMIGNVYLYTGEYTKAIAPLSSALAIFRDIGNIINEGLVLLNMTELLINIGQFDEAKKLITDAEKILSDFQDPAIVGYLNYYKGNIAFQRLEITKAIKHIESSIEQFQIAQNQQDTYKRYLLLVRILIYDQQYHEADINLKKINPLEKQVRDAEDVLLADCLRFFIRTLQNDLSPEEGVKILKNIKGSTNKKDSHFMWWYLTLSFSILGEHKTSNRCLKESKKILSGKVTKITDKSHRDGFINDNIIHQQIMNLNGETLKDLTDSFKTQPVFIEMSKFCSECGYANIDKKLFCPECGYDLKID